MSKELPPDESAEQSSAASESAKPTESPAGRHGNGTMIRQVVLVALLGLAVSALLYDYRIARWLTYNEQRIPFPFSDFPDSIEEPDWDPDVRESEALGFELSDDEEDDDELRD